MLHQNRQLTQCCGSPTLSPSVGWRHLGNSALLRPLFIVFKVESCLWEVNPECQYKTNFSTTVNSVSLIFIFYSKIRICSDISWTLTDRLRQNVVFVIANERFAREGGQKTKLFVSLYVILEPWKQDCVSKL